MCTEDRSQPAADAGQPKYVSPAEERVLIRAARLRIDCNIKLGLATEVWVKTLAARPIPPYDRPPTAPKAS